MSAPLENLKTALADRYAIERSLGAGGMATVFLARDLKHDRNVAIKVLRPELAAALGHERFLREITTTANLRHPHILPLYDSGKAGDSLFYVMPFVEGESLRDRLNRERQLPVDAALEVACEIADALCYAHTRGVIHRDIKPENILLERGHAVLADFGIARSVTSAGGEKLTETGLAIGTPLYMSPEQASAVEAVDARSDLYSLACVVYEMLAGQPPFIGSSMMAVIAHHALDPVPPLRTTRPGLPAHVAGAIERALAKAPADRYPTVAAWREALTQSAEVSASDMPADSGAVRAEQGFWVAVLPFKYTSANTDVAALAEGLSEEVITGLSRFSYLRVVARSAAPGRTGDLLDVRDVASELGARYVLEGSLRHAGTRLRVAVQLIEATTGVHLWVENYERSFSPETVFELQDDLTARIVATFGDRFGALARTISEAVREKPADQLRPYEALMRGFGYHFRLSPAEHAEARAALERAVKEAPANADCWAMLSWVYSHEHAHGFNPQPGSLDRALAAAERAVDLAPANQLAQQALAVVLFFRSDTARCVRAAERAIALNPLDTSNEAMFLLAFTGDWDRGCDLIRRAAELNPHHPGWYEGILAINEYRKANYRAAMELCAKGEAPHALSRLLVAAAHGQLGEPTPERAALQDYLAHSPGSAAGFARWFGTPVTKHLMDGLRKAGLDVPSGDTG